MRSQGFAAEDFDWSFRINNIKPRDNNTGKFMSKAKQARDIAAGRIPKKSQKPETTRPQKTRSNKTKSYLERLMDTEFPPAAVHKSKRAQAARRKVDSGNIPKTRRAPKKTGTKRVRAQLIGPKQRRGRQRKIPRPDDDNLNTSSSPDGTSSSNQMNMNDMDDGYQMDFVVSSSSHIASTSAPRDVVRQPRSAHTAKICSSSGTSHTTGGLKRRRGRPPKAVIAQRADDDVDTLDIPSSSSGPFSSNQPESDNYDVPPNQPSQRHPTPDMPPPIVLPKEEQDDHQMDHTHMNDGDNLLTRSQPAGGSSVPVHSGNNTVRQLQPAQAQAHSRNKGQDQLQPTNRYRSQAGTSTARSGPYDRPGQSTRNSNDQADETQVLPVRIQAGNGNVQSGHPDHIQSSASMSSSRDQAETSSARTRPYDESGQSASNSRQNQPVEVHGPSGAFCPATQRAFDSNFFRSLLIINTNGAKLPPTILVPKSICVPLPSQSYEMEAQHSPAPPSPEQCSTPSSLPQNELIQDQEDQMDDYHQLPAAPSSLHITPTPPPELAKLREAHAAKRITSSGTNHGDLNDGPQFSNGTGHMNLNDGVPSQSAQRSPTPDIPLPIRLPKEEQDDQMEDQAAPAPASPEPYSVPNSRPQDLLQDQEDQINDDDGPSSHRLAPTSPVVYSVSSSSSPNDFRQSSSPQFSPPTAQDDVDGSSQDELLEHKPELLPLPSGKTVDYEDWDRNNLVDWINRVLPGEEMRPKRPLLHSIVYAQKYDGKIIKRLAERDPELIEELKVVDGTFDVLHVWASRILEKCTEEKRNQESMA